MSQKLCQDQKVCRNKIIAEQEAESENKFVGLTGTVYMFAAFSCTSSFSDTNSALINLFALCCTVKHMSFS